MLVSVLGEDVEVSRSVIGHSHLYFGSGIKGDETVYTFTHINTRMRMVVADRSFIAEDFYERFASAVVLCSKFGTNKLVHTIAKSQLLKSLYQGEN